MAPERAGIPIGWCIDGANRNDVAMLEPTLDAIASTGLLADVGTMHLDRGYGSGAVRQRLVAHGIIDFAIQRRGTKIRASRSSRHGASRILIVCGRRCIGIIPSSGG